MKKQRKHYAPEEKVANVTEDPGRRRSKPLATRDHLPSGCSFACASRIPAAGDSMLRARASAAHAVAAAEIHWSCSKGNPLWKYGWNPTARLRTCQDPSGYWVLRRY